MKVHLIYEPNGRGAEVRMHKAGCRDISRDLRRCTSHYELEVASQREAAEDFFSDFIAEESMSAEKTFSIPISFGARTACRRALPIGNRPNADARFAPAVIIAKANGTDIGRYR